MKKQLCHGIDLSAPGGINQLLDFHRRTFGDAVMEGDPNDVPPVEPPAAGNPPAVQDPDEKLGEGGLKALQAERKRAEAAEARVKAFEEAQAEAEKAKLSDIERAQTDTQAANERAEKAEAALAVHQLAIKHGISSPADLELLSSVTDEAARETLAARIAQPSAPGTPKVDPSSGAKPDVKHHSVADQIAAAEKDGDLAAAARLKAQQLGALANNQN